MTGYDYASPGVYFVTVCAHRKECVFGGQDIRESVERAWHQIPQHFPNTKLDEFVVMPNHVHGILWILDDDPKGDVVGAQHAAPPPASPTPRVRPGSLGAIVRSFKSAATRRVNEVGQTPGTPFWQRNYYEHVIRDEDELGRIRQYILDNPLQWELDRENPHRVANRGYGGEWAWLEGT